MRSPSSKPTERTPRPITSIRSPFSLHNDTPSSYVSLQIYDGCARSFSNIYDAAHRKSNCRKLLDPRNPEQQRSNGLRERDQLCYFAIQGSARAGARQYPDAEPAVSGRNRSPTLDQPCCRECFLGEILSPSRLTRSFPISLESPTVVGLITLFTSPLVSTLYVRCIRDVFEAS